MNDPILGFADHYPLSNFCPAKVTCGGVLVGNVEVAYQASKVIDPTWRARLLALENPGKAKREASRAPWRVDWPVVRVDVMRGLLQQKFSWPQFRKALLATGDRDIFELNRWGDTFWGVVQDGDRLVGENQLGRLLMELREELRDPLRLPRTIIAFDLEATCWLPEEKPVAGLTDGEIIEIGAVAWTQGADDRALAEFQSFVQPVEHPALSAFCTELTAIRQDDVRDAPLLHDALQGFFSWCDGFGPHLLASWGQWDATQIRDECTRKEIPLSLFESRHVNAKSRFAALRGMPKQVGMGKAATMLGIGSSEPAHRAIADARTLACILDESLGQSLLREAQHDPGSGISDG